MRVGNTNSVVVRWWLRGRDGTGASRAVSRSRMCARGSCATWPVETRSRRGRMALAIEAIPETLGTALGRHGSKTGIGNKMFRPVPVGALEGDRDGRTLSGGGCAPGWEPVLRISTNLDACAGARASKSLWRRGRALCETKLGLGLRPTCYHRGDTTVGDVVASLRRAWKSTRRTASMSRVDVLAAGPDVGPDVGVGGGPRPRQRALPAVDRLPRGCGRRLRRGRHSLTADGYAPQDRSAPELNRVS